jgi:hypothetical protein
MKAVTILIIITLTCKMQAQEDVSTYFDDGGISNPKNIIKVNANYCIGGDISFSYEYIFTDRFALEAGYGTITHIFDIFGELDEYVSKNLVEGGYSYLILPKMYFLQKAPLYNYCGILYRNRLFKHTYKDVYVRDISVVYGVQFNWGKRVYFDYIVGIGNSRIRSYKRHTYDNIENTILFSLRLSLGISF